jgi:FkbM family methyltransferase
VASVARRRLGPIVRWLPQVSNRFGRAPTQGKGRLVTEDDIHACYRLILGREPDPDGLEYWRAAVGKLSVDELVGGMMDSREFHLSPLFRRILAAGEDWRGQGRRAVQVDLPGRVQFVDPTDQFVGQVIQQKGMYEPHVTSAFSEVLRSGHTIIDVGANVGWFALLAASAVGSSGSVLAVEADSGNVDLLCQSVRANRFDNVFVLPVAASDRSEMVVLQRAGGSNSAIFPSSGPSAPGDRLVPTLPLDALAGMVDRLDVMKIDVEGAELLVLRGASELVGKHRPYLFFEYSPGMLGRLPRSSADELDHWLAALGYELDVIALDGALIRVGSLAMADEYLRSDRHDHLDVKASPSG